MKNKNKKQPKQKLRKISGSLLLRLRLLPTVPALSLFVLDENGYGLSQSAYQKVRRS